MFKDVSPTEEPGGASRHCPGAGEPPAARSWNSALAPAEWTPRGDILSVSGVSLGSAQRLLSGHLLMLAREGVAGGAASWRSALRPSEGGWNSCALASVPCPQVRASEAHRVARASGDTPQSLHRSHPACSEGPARPWHPRECMFKVTWELKLPVCPRGGGQPHSLRMTKKLEML